MVTRCLNLCPQPALRKSCVGGALATEGAVAVMSCVVCAGDWKCIYIKSQTASSNSINFPAAQIEAPLKGGSQQITQYAADASPYQVRERKRHDHLPPSYLVDASVRMSKMCRRFSGRIRADNSRSIAPLAMQRLQRRVPRCRHRMLPLWRRNSVQLGRATYRSAAR